MAAAALARRTPSLRFPLRFTRSSSPSSSSSISSLLPSRSPISRFQRPVRRYFVSHFIFFSLSYLFFSSISECFSFAENLWCWARCSRSTARLLLLASSLSFPAIQTLAFKVKSSPLAVWGLNYLLKIRHQFGITEKGLQLRKESFFFPTCAF